MKQKNSCIYLEVFLESPQRQGPTSYVISSSLSLSDYWWVGGPPKRSPNLLKDVLVLQCGCVSFAALNCELVRFRVHGSGFRVSGFSAGGSSHYNFLTFPARKSRLGLT